ncbi:MAG: hypothetical protein C0412_15710 [Flavobacterium sp.]|nr:hypothetical protein [Flavobacterium sp.]
MNLKKLKIILSIPLALFFIVSLFYFPTQVKAEQECKWIYETETCASFPLSATSTDANCSKIKPDIPIPTRCQYGISSCVCCCKQIIVPTPSKINATMPKIIMPELQIKIPGLNNFTKANCKTENGKITSCDFPWISEYIAGVYKYAIGIVGILAAVVLMIGGVLWVIAGGNATTIGEAKAWIGASLTGLVIALCSYTILYQINPDLLNFKPLTLGVVQEMEEFIKAKTGGTAEKYKNMPCPTAKELADGVEIYTTGYYAPVWGDDHKSLCMIAMNCSCPNGKDSKNNCDDIFPNYDKGYQPCKQFPRETPYCNATGRPPYKAPHLGNPTSVAAPLCIKDHAQLCINKKNYVVDDVGGAIQGRRIDIWSGNSIEATKANTMVTTMKLGPCQ